MALLLFSMLQKGNIHSLRLSIILVLELSIQTATCHATNRSTNSVKCSEKFLLPILRWQEWNFWYPVEPLGGFPGWRLFITVHSISRKLVWFPFSAQEFGIAVIFLRLRHLGSSERWTIFCEHETSGHASSHWFCIPYWELSFSSTWIQMMDLTIQPHGAGHKIPPKLQVSPNLREPPANSQARERRSQGCGKVPSNNVGGGQGTSAEHLRMYYCGMQLHLLRKGFSQPQAKKDNNYEQWQSLGTTITAAN